MQGRNLQRLNDIRERRQAEDAEARAREEALQRRAEGLRAWMAAVCQRHREERELKAAAAAAGLAGGDGNPAADGDAEPDSGNQQPASNWSDADSDGAGATAVLQAHFAAAWQALATPPALAAAAGSGGGAASQQQGPGWRWGRGETGRGKPVRGAGGKQGLVDSTPDSCLSVVGKQAAGCIDSARTSAAGGPLTSSTSGSKRRPLSAGPLTSRPTPVTVEAVIEQRQAAAADAAAAAAASLPAAEQQHVAWEPSRPSSGSAALAAWGTLSRQHSTAAEAATAAALGRGQAQAQPPAPWQHAAWDMYGCPPGARPPSSCGHFLQRVATFTAAQQGAQAGAAAAADQARDELAELSLCRSSGSLVDSPGGYSSGGRGVLGQQLPEGLASTYIPPAMLSALHTVRMSPRLMSGLRSPAAGTAVQQQEQQQQRRGIPCGRQLFAHQKGTDGSSGSTISSTSQRSSLGQSDTGHPWHNTSSPEAGGLRPPIPCQASAHGSNGDTISEGGSQAGQQGVAWGGSAG